MRHRVSVSPVLARRRVGRIPDRLEIRPPMTQLSSTVASLTQRLQNNFSDDRTTQRLQNNPSDDRTTQPISFVAAIIFIA
jgi:hypothetical protein